MCCIMIRKRSGLFIPALSLLFCTAICMMLPSPSLADAGDLDPTFGDNGVHTLDVGAYYPSSISGKCSAAVRADGAVYAVISTSGYGYYTPSVNTLVRVGANGSLDNSFGPNGNVYSQYVDGTWESPVALQNGSRVIVGAITHNPTGNRDLSLVALTEAGVMDSGFGVNGRTELKVDSDSYDDLLCIQVLKSGDLVALTRSRNVDSNYQFQFNQFTLTKIKSDGHIDHSFGTSGRVHLDLYDTRSSIYDITEQADGKLLISGGIGVDGTYTSEATLIRYLPNGDLDSTFGINGWVTESDISYFNVVASQDDGKVLAIGSDGIYGYNYYVNRYNQDGSPDPGFGNPDHKIFTSTESQIYGGTPNISDIAIQQNGRILLGGSMQYYSASPSYSWSEFAVIALDSGGAIDSTYGDGVVTTPFQIDPMVGDPVVSNGLSLNLLGDDKVLLAGNINSLLDNEKSTNVNLAFVRYTASGSEDVDYANAGKAIVNVNSDISDDWINSLSALQADGKILTATTNIGKLGADFVLTRHNADGSLDTSFNGTGIVTTDIQTIREVSDYGYIYTNISDDYVASIAVQEDGKILLAGDSAITNNSKRESSFVLVRYHQDGTLDADFGDNGIVITSIGDGISYYNVSDFMGDMLIQPDGKIVVTGGAWFDQSPPAPGYEFVTIRYNSDGTLDPAFGNGGYVVTNGYTARKNDYPTSIALQSDGKIVVGGAFSGLTGSPNKNPALIRYHANGVLDTSFGNGGKITPLYATDFRWRHFPLKDLVITTEEKILMVGGICTSENGWCHTLLAQFNDDGSPDTSFGDQGVVRSNFGNPYTAEYVEKAAVQKDGRIIVTGQSVYLDRVVGADEALARGLGTQRVHFTQYDILLSRFLADGSPDYTFGDGGTVNVDIGYSFDGAYAVIVQPDAKIVTGGYIWVGFDDVFGHWNLALTRHEGISTTNDEIEGLIYHLEDLVKSGVLSDGQGKQLTGYLQASLQQTDLGNYSAVIRQLNNFINAIEKFTGNGILPADDAAVLITNAEAIITTFE